MCTSTRKLVTDLTGIREDRGYTTGDQICTRNFVRNLEPLVDKKAQFEIDPRTEGLSQDAFFYRMKRRWMNSTKSCPFVTDVSKGKMIFSKETGHAINEMVNLEVIELWQTSAKVQCLVCLKKHVSEGLNMCQCGVWLRPNQLTIDRIWATFAALKKAILSYYSSLIKMEKKWT